MVTLLTNDVETTSLINGGLRDETGIKVWREGMPLLLDIYAKYDIKSTFFFVADFAEKCPDIVKMILPYGHEVACHGLTHDHRLSFDSMIFYQQVEHLKRAKQILEDIAGQEVVSFRAPALRVNSSTPAALIEAGFKIDSSIAPQRLDMFMTLGAKDKLQWLFAPRKTYITSDKNLARKGISGLIEVPVSSFAMPYIGTFMRIFSNINVLTRLLLYLETRNAKNKAINFLIHPNELILEDDLKQKGEKRSNNIVTHFLSDVLRKQMKKKNLGQKAADLFEKEIIFWKNKNYTFLTIRNYVELCQKQTNTY
jgi:peptidoglycan/xylan/chitin deacetylase (PgdA/CDA1 family)